MSKDIIEDRILVIDFGSQYTQLIARRVREIGVYCEIYHHKTSLSVIKKFNPQGIILSGGPETVKQKGSPKVPDKLFDLGIPILGICYGMQAIAKQLGGKVELAEKREFGHADLILKNCSLINVYSREILPETQIAISQDRIAYVGKDASHAKGKKTVVMDLDKKYVTLNYFKTYIKDPSNEDEKFLRVRIRKYRKNMEKEGLDTGKIIKTVNNLLSANKALNFYKNKALYKHVSFLSKNKCLINKRIFSEEAKEIIFKSFSDILSLVSGTYYPPRSRKIINLIDRLKKDKFAKSTLGGCIVEKKNNFILISKELKLRKMPYQPQK